MQRAVFLAVLTAVSLSAAKDTPAPIVIDYPAEQSIFPPEFPAPTFLWRDASTGAATWRVRVKFGDGSRALEVNIPAERMAVGRIDERAVSDTNEVPKLTAEQQATRTWVPDEKTWAAIKQHSVRKPATVTIAGYSADGQQASEGNVSFTTSKDPVGAPIFYRDVPLMPSELKKGIIKPLDESAIPLIEWKLRDVGARDSRILMTGLHTCANCHSFSRDGKTLGLDVDGPANDKGLYALVPVKREMAIRNEDVIAWSTFRGKLGGKLRVGFMSQVSPDGQYITTTINDPGLEDRRHIGDIVQNYYVANFKNYKFLQVFYPTRGIIAWYSRETGKLQPLPGADNPKYVHTNAVWSPDGKYLVFARAEAKDAYPPGIKMAEYANDPNETQIQYDLYRIPFNNGKGGVAERIEGASANGMSNTFPKISPDGKWIVFVKCRNGQLMRPDSELYIVPVTGGEPRKMRCNQLPMNSWHSFSPNGRWLVFSSKRRGPFTKMYLTHIDENGNDSPAVLIDNATAANRAVNIPEFVNVPPGSIDRIDTPAMEFYRVFNVANELAKRRDFNGAVEQWKKAAELNPSDARVPNNLGLALTEINRGDEAVPLYRRAIQMDPGFSEAETNLAIALAGKGEFDEAISHFEKALALSPDDIKARTNLAGALVEKGRIEEGIEQCQKALAIDANSADAHNNLAIALVKARRLDEAVPHFEKALEGNPDSVPMHYNLAQVLGVQGRWAEALPHMEKAAAGNDPTLVSMLAAAYFQAGRLDDALSAGQRALALAREQHNDALANAIAQRVAALQARLKGGAQ